MTGQDRRTFLKEIAASVAAPKALARGTALAARGPNDKIVVGLIGCGGRGTHDAGLFKKTPNVEVAYVCDVDEGRPAATAAKAGRRNAPRPSPTCGGSSTTSRSTP